MHILTTIDMIWLNVVQPASPNWTSQISYEAVSSPPIQVSYPTEHRYITSLLLQISNDGSLDAAHAHIDDDRYDMVECGAAGQLKLDLSDHFLDCSMGFL